MKNSKILLSVFMVLIIICVSVAPAFAEGINTIESNTFAEKIEVIDDEVWSDEFGEGSYNNDEKIFCTATIDDDFDDDSLLVVMKNKASLNFDSYEIPEFSTVNPNNVREITENKSEKILSEFNTHKSECIAELKNMYNNGSVLVRNSIATVTGNTMAALDNKLIEKNAEIIAELMVEKEYSKFHKIIHVELNTKSKQNVLDAIKEIEKNEEVLAVEPNYILEKTGTVANDPQIGGQWALNNASIKSAWNITTGSSSVKVGVIDDGIDASHPDLAGNYDSQLSKSFTDAPANRSVGGHGTAVAGVIGAVGNNSKGIAGACWDVSLVSLQVCNELGEVYFDKVVSALEYAIENNISVLNYSYSGRANVASFNAVLSEYNGIFISCAGNFRLDIENTDSENINEYPLTIESNKAIFVAAIDEDNELWVNPDGVKGSNYGANSVDLAAPGDNIKTTSNGSYENWSGTSLATPYVAGVAALIKSNHSDISYLGIRKAILDGVDKETSLNGKVSTGGKLNAYKALNNVGKIKYTIEYDGNGGVGSMIDTSITYGFYTNLSNVTFTKSQCNFDGWYVYRARDNKYYYKSPSGSKKWYREGSQPAGYTKVVYANQTPIGHLSTVNGDVITMVAKWEPYMYTMVFQANGASGKMNDIKCEYNKNIILNNLSYKYPGYAFEGWQVCKYLTDTDEVWLYTNGESYGWYTKDNQPENYSLVMLEDKATFCNEDEVIDGVELYFVAQWSLIEYPIRYDPNGGSGTMEDTIGSILQEVRLRNNSFTKEHNKFLGWHIVDSYGNWSSTHYDNWWDEMPNGYEEKLYEDGAVVNYIAESKGVALTAVAQWLLLGDVDLDGVISIMDATLIQHHFAQMVTLTDEQISHGDFNEDGAFDVTDATAIRMYLISGNS